MPSLVGGTSHRNVGRGAQANRRGAGKSSSSAKRNGRMTRSIAAIAVLCSVGGLLDLSENSGGGSTSSSNLSSYFWGYAGIFGITTRGASGLVARILLAAEKYEFKDEGSGENSTSSSAEAEHSSVGERQMLKIVSRCVHISYHFVLYVYFVHVEASCKCVSNIYF